MKAAVAKENRTTVTLAASASPLAIKETMTANRPATANRMEETARLRNQENQTVNPFIQAEPRIAKNRGAETDAKIKISRGIRRNSQKNIKSALISVFRGIFLYRLFHLTTSYKTVFK